MLDIADYLALTPLSYLSDLGELIKSFPEFDGYIPLSPFKAQGRLQLAITHSSQRYVPAAQYVSKWRLGALRWDGVPILILRQGDEQDPHPLRFVTPDYSLELYHEIVTYIQRLYPSEGPTGDYHIEMAWSNTLPPPQSYLPPDIDTGGWAAALKYTATAYGITSLLY